MFDGNIELARCWGVVVHNQQFLFRQLTQKCVVTVVPSDVPLPSGTQRGVAIAERQQRLHIGEYLLLFGRASAGGEGVSRITRKASRKVAAVVGVGAARHRDFVTRINLRYAAQG